MQVIVKECFYFLEYAVHIYQNRLALSKQKRRILFFTFCKLFIKNLFFIIIFKHNLNQETLLGWKIEFFSYAAFYSMFKDIFVEHNYFFKTDKIQPLIIDAGTNIGLEILYYKWLYPRAKIIAFEPDPATFNLLKENIRTNNFKDIKIYNKALGLKKGRVKFYCNSADPGSLIMSTSNQRGFYDFIYVNDTTLSSYIKTKVDFVKMDIEGAELQVFTELARSNKLMKIRQLTIEYHHHITKSKDELSKFLKILETNKFSYQLITKLNPPILATMFQDILILAVKKNNSIQ